jgi:hypothetical protein
MFQHCFVLLKIFFLALLLDEDDNSIRQPLHRVRSNSYNNLGPIISPSNSNQASGFFTEDRWYGDRVILNNPKSNPAPVFSPMLISQSICKLIHDMIEENSPLLRELSPRDSHDDESYTGHRSSKRCISPSDYDVFNSGGYRSPAPSFKTSRSSQVLSLLLYFHPTLSPYLFPSMLLCLTLTPPIYIVFQLSFACIYII